MSVLTRRIDFVETQTGIRGQDTGRCQLLEVSYQRNGVSGIGFNHIRFLYTPCGVDGSPSEHLTVELHGVLADVDEGVRFAGVVDPRNLDNHWRGDRFEAFLRSAVDAWSKELDL